MKRIFEGLALFQREAYPRNRDLFERLARKQTPHAVFVTCSDSRVVPNLIVQAEPGDLFIIRNVGNIVPPAGSAYGGTMAALEYAVVALGLPDIIVCGHSDCGAMRGVLHPETLTAMPSVRQWVSYAERARHTAVESRPGAPDDVLMDALVGLNVIEQVRNVLTFPFVAPRVEKGGLHVHGWVYDISSGTVRALDRERRRFAPIFCAEGALAPRLPSWIEADEELWRRL